MGGDGGAVGDLVDEAVEVAHLFGVERSPTQRRGRREGQRNHRSTANDNDAERSAHAARLGEIPDQLWVDCVVASNVDPGLAPEGRHVMTCFVQYVPYRLRDSNWDGERERLGDRVVQKIGESAPNVPGAVLARQVLTPLDLERTYGLTEGNIFHGDLSLEQLFFMRPVRGWSSYATPVQGLNLCGAGAHPGGGVTGAPGHKAARRAIGAPRRTLPVTKGAVNADSCPWSSWKASIASFTVRPSVRRKNFSQ